MEKTIDIKGLVNDADNGDQNAWTELYHATFREAYFVAIKVTKNEQDAADLVHDAYITAFEKLEQLGDRSKFQAWLNMIVANKCRDFLRKNKPLLFTEMQVEDGVDPEWADDREYGQPEMTFDHGETVRLVAEIIEDLPEDQRLCVTLYYRDELSVGEIAQALEVSEGTVKSRLNYARKKVKTKVEELEKQGVKLYGIAPLPLLIWLLRSETAYAKIPASVLSVPSVPAVLAAPVVAETAVATSAQSAAVGVGAKAGVAGIMGKVIAGVAAISVAVGGVAIYSANQNREERPDVSQGVVSEMPDAPAKDPVQEAYAVYEELLMLGTTEQGLQIEYYSYLDLDKDEIPELIVADADGTPDSWSSAEVYTYRASGLSFCGATSVHYDNFYYVNEAYLMGQHRMGKQYISTSEYMKTTIYHWDEAMTRNDPAISRNNGDWEYITQEEFEYYNTMPSDGSSGASFIETAEPITLLKNDMAQPNLLERTLDFSAAWCFFVEMNGEPYHVCFAFEESGDMFCTLSIAATVGAEVQPIEPIGFYDGSYTVYRDIITINLGEQGDWSSISYQFDPDSLLLTLTSEQGFFIQDQTGDVFELQKDKWNDAAKIKGMVEYNVGLYEAYS